ncbi:protein SSXT isoform X3 [Stegostoma tigrinum]|uniref:protein SSXT isoform X3 n=1 Tax=Stegostoma tigrinum TaxID=3053191 RepID=UPI00202B5462|nr:protein SSXT isoform X3 [Stegostoma tigrinum]
MSVAFATPRQRGKGEITPAAIQKLLDENNQLIQCIMDYQSKGKTAECSQYQQMLHRNLVYLATIADSNQNMQSLLPAPPSQSMPMGPGGMNQLPPGHSMGTDGMVSGGGGGPPTSHMQNQMNGQMPGPNHMPVQGPGQPSMANASVSMPTSSHGSMGGYSHSVPSSQGMPVQSQMNMNPGQSMNNYGPRTNMNMQPSQGPMMHQQASASQYNMPQGASQHYPNQPPMPMMNPVNQANHMMGQRQMPPYRPAQQGPLQQYAGQEDYYNDQFNHGQGTPESMNQQYYPDGPNDYSYHQASYPEQGYDRPYEDSSQHYYEGGNSQYSQQQETYQQGPPQQQGYAQQQYTTQQGYPGQQQGYGSSQPPPNQYANYPQGQGQQYGGYRPPQPGPPQQQQRPYGYEQNLQ